MLAGWRRCIGGEKGRVVVRRIGIVSRWVDWRGIGGCSYLLVKSWLCCSGRLIYCRLIVDSLDVV